MSDLGTDEGTDLGTDLTGNPPDEAQQVTTLGLIDLIVYTWQWAVDRTTFYLGEDLPILFHIRRKDGKSVDTPTGGRIEIWDENHAEIVATINPPELGVLVETPTPDLYAGALWQPSKKGIFFVRPFLNINNQIPGYEQQIEVV